MRKISNVYFIFNVKRSQVMTLTSISLSSKDHMTLVDFRSTNKKLTGKQSELWRVIVVKLAR